MPVSRVASGSNTSSSATSLVVDLGAAPTAGNLLWAEFYTGNTNTGASALTAPTGWTRYEGTGGASGTTGASPIALFYRVAAAGDPQSWTFSATGGATFMALFAAEYASGSGAWVTPLDQSGFANGTTASLTIAASAANTQATDFGIAGIGATGTTSMTGTTWSGGFTDGGTNIGSRLRHATKEMSAVETTSTTYTLAASATTRGALGTFKIPAAAPATQNVSVALLTSTAATYNPTVTPGPVTVAPPLLTSTAATYNPTVVPGTVTLAPPLLTSTAAVYSPTATGSMVTASPPLLTSTAATYSPTATPGPVTLAPPLLTSTAAVFTPSALGIISVAPLRATSTAKVFAPNIDSPPTNVGVELLGSVPAVYAPVIGTQTFASVPMFNRFPALLEPTVLSTAYVTLEALTSTFTTYTPSAARFLPVAPPLLTKTPVASAPTALAHAVVSMERLSSEVLALAPAVGTEIVEVLLWNGQQWVSYETVRWNGLTWEPTMPMVEGRRLG